MQVVVARLEHFARLRVGGVDGDAVGDGAELDALRLLEGANAFRAALLGNELDIVACGDRVIGAVGLAVSAVDAAFGDHHRHWGESSFPAGDCHGGGLPSLMQRHRPVPVSYDFAA